MKILDINSLGEYINVVSIPNDWAEYYEEALKNFDRNWLKIDFKEMFLFYELDEEFRKRFLDEINVLNNDVNLNFLVYLWYYLNKNDYKIPRWQNEDANFKDNGSFMMPVVSMLMGYKNHKEMMLKNKYDFEQIKYHKENIKLTCTSDKKRLGIDGIRFSQMIWGSRFMKGHIIQVGTLQYELKTNSYNGEDVIYIHIPRNASFEALDLEYTFNNARKYVNKYLTTNNYNFITDTWLLSPELDIILKPNSRIRNFQKYF